MSDAHTDNHTDDHGDASQDTRAGEHLVNIPPFSPYILGRQLWTDALLRWGALVVLAGALGYLLAMEQQGSLVYSLGAVGLIMGWIALGLISARVARQLPHIAASIEIEPDEGEHLLSWALKRRPLMRWVRLVLYHRLAVLRHHQRRYGEVVGICEAVVSYPLGPAEDSRPSLLLLLTETYLEMRHLPGAYTALLRLHALPLSLIESLQRLTLQTRYEILAGHYAAAMANVNQKVQMAELMPAHQCGAMHVMLAAAARLSKRDDLSNHLWQRAKLFCTRKQLEQVWGLGNF